MYSNASVNTFANTSSKTGIYLEKTARITEFILDTFESVSEMLSVTHKTEIFRFYLLDHHRFSLLRGNFIE